MKEIIKIVSWNIQHLTELKVKEVLKINADAVLLQELNFSNNHKDNERILREIMDSTWKLYSNKKVGILLNGPMKNHVVKVKRPENGRSITVCLNSVNLTSIYGPTNAMFKPDFFSRVLYTSIKGATEMVPTILAGDLNAHLETRDSCTLLSNGGIERNTAMTNGVLRNFLIVSGFKIASDGSFTHTQMTSKGILFSRKDYILTTGELKTIHYQTNESSLSDHHMLEYTCRINSHSQASDTENSQDCLPPRFKDRMRKYTDTKRDFFSLYSKYAMDDNSLQWLKNTFYCKSLQTERLRANRIRISWDNPTEAYENVSIFLSSTAAQEKFSMGPCFYRIQRIQENMRIPNQFEDYTRNEQVNWIHRALGKSVTQVTRTLNKGSGNKKCQNNVNVNVEHEKWVYYKEMIQLLRKAMYFHENTQQRKRLFGIIRQRCPSIHLHRPAQALRLLDYFTKLKNKKENILKSAKFNKRIRTKRFLRLGETSLKRMFEDITDQNIDFSSTFQEQEEEVDYVEREEMVAHKLQNWVTPMTPPEPEIQIGDEFPTADTETPLAQFRNWVYHHNLVNTQELWNQLRYKNVETDWNDVVKPITIEDLDNACKNKDSSPGYSRITYRMILYAAPKLKELVVKVMTGMLGNGIIPECLKVGLIRPIPKRPGVPVHDECRPIILLEAMWKAFTIILSRRLQQKLREMQVLLPSAHGFMSSKKLCTPIIVKQLVEEHARKKQRPLLSAELDISKAYDYTRQHVLIAALDRLKFPPNLLTLVKCLTNQTKNYILSGKRIIGESTLNTLRQGDPFSCLLFVMQLDILLCAIDNYCMGYELENESRITCMAYADDISSFHSNTQEVQQTLAICGEFFAMNNQAINPQKSVIKKLNFEGDVTVAIYGKALPTIEGSACSRYLGVWLQPDGGIQGSRSKVDELLSRFRNLLKTKTCSAHVRATVVNMKLFPKMLHILGNMCWRQQDLDKYEKKVKNIISKDANANVIFGSKAEGGMGIKSPKVQPMVTLIQSVLRHINRNDEERIAQQWIRANSIESTSGWRERHFNITVWIYQLFYELALEEAQMLNTGKNPLSIPVALFNTKKDSSLEFIRTMREYLTRMRLTVFDTHTTQLTQPNLEIYDVLPVKEAFRMAAKKPNWAERNLKKPANSFGYRFPTEMIWDGWFLNPGHKSLRKSIKTARTLTNMSGAQSGTMDQLVWNPVRTNSTPTNQCLGKWSVVGYNFNFKHVGIGKDIGSHPQLGIIWFEGSETVELIPVEWKWTTEADEVFQASVMAPTLKTSRDLVVKYSPPTAHRRIYGWEVTIPKEYWKRDSNVLVIELIRRNYAKSTKEFLPDSTNYLPVPGALRLLNDQILDIYTDGSLTEREGIIHMGAAAIIYRNSRILGHYACSIPPVNTHITNKHPGTVKPETVGAALGAWVAYNKYFRACNLFIDNLAVVNALREKNFERLVRFDPHAGELLKELNERKVLNKITWIKGHQKSRSIQSLANDLADKIAEAARRQARIVGFYESLPLLPHHELQIVSMKDGGEFQLPEYRSTTIEIPRPVVPDATAILQGWTNKDILESQQAHMYRLPWRARSPLDDTPDEITLTAMSLRITSGLLPISPQKLVDRPDVFGNAPPCPACHQPGCFSSSIAGWKHLLFGCQLPSIKRTVIKYIHEADQRIIGEAIHSAQEKKWDKSSLTEVDSRNDFLEQRRSCRKCVIPRMVLNAKAGDTNPGSERKTKYRLDLYHWHKANYEVYQIWKRLLDEFGISIDITILDSLMIILVDKEPNICIKELEPTHLGPSIWLKPKSKAEIKNEFGIRAIHWSPVLAITGPLCWWNFDVITGNVCRHKDSLPQGIVVYVKKPDAISLERLRTLWNSFYVKNMSGMDRESRDLGVWFNGSEVFGYIKDVPGINSSTIYANTWTPPTETLRYDPTHWWLGRTEEDVILWYQGRLHRGDTMQQNLLKFSRLAQRIEGHFRKRYNTWCNENEIKSPILWDRQHYREFKRRPQTVQPYIELTPTQKKVYTHVLAQNRRAIAANQRKTISITDSLPNE